jgi:tRNA(fMet)-specific endonuclease VapC
MSGKRCVDTTVVIRLLNGEPGVLERFDAAEQICVTPVVVGELLFGAAGSARASHNIAKLDAFLQDVVILDWNRQVGQQYAEVKLALKRKGKPIPENDIWIGAFALAYGMCLAARDAHFDEIDGLAVERW